MSIVERALQKLRQQAAAAQRTPVAPPSGRVLPSETTPDVVPPGAPSPPLKTIDLDLAHLRVSRLLPPPDQERDLAAQYRQIKRPLVQRATGRGAERVNLGNAIMIASALPGEGKTFTALNLALSMALEQELKVLLVDADVAKPRLSREFDLLGDRGLLDVLAGESLLVEDLVIGTELPSLSLLPAGTLSSTATELLAGPRMEQLVKELCDRDAERIVLFDSPPILPTTEARALAHAMGQIIVVVRAGHTPQHALLETLHLIGERDNVSLVLTHAMDSGAGSHYYSAYSYGDYSEQPASGQGSVDRAG